MTPPKTEQQWHSLVSEREQREIKFTFDIIPLSIRGNWTLKRFLREHEYQPVSVRILPKVRPGFHLFSFKTDLIPCNSAGSPQERDPALCSFLERQVLCLLWAAGDSIGVGGQVPLPGTRCGRTQRGSGWGWQCSRPCMCRGDVFLQIWILVSIIEGKRKGLGGRE